MPEADVYTKNYISQDAIFADVFNFLIYDGEQVIKPESLKDESSAESTIVFIDSEKDGKKAESTQKYRDVFKSLVIKRDSKTSYFLLGIENQSDIHYAMPVKNAVYDMLQYDKQVKTIAEKHKQSKDKMTSGEFLSGFTKSDTLIPVITLVIYFGAEKWDAPLSIHEMFAQSKNHESKYDARLMKFVQNYKINLIEPVSLTDDELKKFTTDFRQVMEFLKYSNDKQKMQELLRMDSSYKNISTQAALVLNACTNIGIKINQNKEKTNMCKAIQEMQQEAVDKACKALQEMQQEAVDKAVEQTVQKEREKRQESILSAAKSLMTNLSWSADQALSSMNVSESECVALKPMLQL